MFTVPCAAHFGICSLVSRLQDPRKSPFLRILSGRRNKIGKQKTETKWGTVRGMSSIKFLDFNLQWVLKYFFKYAKTENKDFM
jgi:hypothetical protein